MLIAISSLQEMCQRERGRRREQKRGMTDYVHKNENWCEENEAGWIQTFERREDLRKEIQLQDNTVWRMSG